MPIKENKAFPHWNFWNVETSSPTEPLTEGRSQEKSRDPWAVKKWNGSRLPWIQQDGLDNVWGYSVLGCLDDLALGPKLVINSRKERKLFLKVQGTCPRKINGKSVINLKNWGRLHIALWIATLLFVVGRKEGCFYCRQPCCYIKKRSRITLLTSWRL